MQLVSFYVPCFNGEKYIAACVESLLALDYPLEDIMVIDDGSTDRTAEIVRQYKQVRLIQQDRNRGLGAARNRGLREARHDLVASIDADVVAAKDWLTSIMRVAEEFPEASGYGGRLIETVSRTLGDKWRDRHLRHDWGARMVRAPFLFSSNTLMRRDHILPLGGYDERFKTHGDDANLADRLREIDRYLVWDPVPVCYHLREDTLMSVLRMHWNYMRSPYAILFPPQNLRELARHIRSRMPTDRLRDDLRNRRYAMALVSVLAIADDALRKFLFYVKGKSRNTQEEHMHDAAIRRRNIR
jgi:glycosyltransferase involved in cell wall biosynthesis